MELDQSQPPYAGRQKHYVYGMKFYLTPSRQAELETILKTFEITKYRLTPGTNVFGSDYAAQAFISFRIKKQAMLFKLVWTPCEAPDMREILPAIRRVMPKVIAHDILGVQPMTGPTSQVFSLRSRYRSTAPASTPPSVSPVRSGDEPGEEPDADRTSE